MGRRRPIKRLLKNFGGWRGLVLGLYFLLSFALLVVLLAQAVAIDIGKGLLELLLNWVDRGPFGVIFVAMICSLVPGIVIGVSKELTRSLHGLVWWVMRTMDWDVSDEGYWGHDSWTWMRVVASRTERPLSTVEASVWWLCQHKEGPEMSTARAARTLGMRYNDVRNALARAERKMEPPT